MKTLTIPLLLVVAVGMLAAAEQDPRITKALETFEKSVGEAKAERDQAIQEIEAEFAEETLKAQQRALRDLKRLVNSRTDAATTAKVYREVLSLDTADTDARSFFEAIGTLDQVLADLEPRVETDLLGNIVAAADPLRSVTIRAESFDIGTFENGALVAPNRDYTWREVPEELSGLRIIRHPFRGNVGDYEVVVVKQGVAFIIIDTFEGRNDLVSLTSNGWADTGLAAKVGKATQPWKIFRKELGRGTHLVPRSHEFVRSMLIFGDVSE